VYLIGSLRQTIGRGWLANAGQRTAVDPHEADRRGGLDFM